MIEKSTKASLAKDLKTATSKAPVPKRVSTPKPKMSAAQFLAETKKANLAKELKSATAKAPTPKVATSSLLKIAKFAGKKSVIGTVALTVLPAVFAALNSGATGAGANRPGAKGASGPGRAATRSSSASTKKLTAARADAASMVKGAKGPKAKINSGSSYRVQHGDTLSGIAARAGVSLAALRAANPRLEPRSIFRNTAVKIPKGGSKPSGGYTGPVPYVPKKKK